MYQEALRFLSIQNHFAFNVHNLPLCITWGNNLLYVLGQLFIIIGGPNNKVISYYYEIKKVITTKSTLHLFCITWGNNYIMCSRTIIHYNKWSKQ